jgi:hypothetical protein
MRLQYSGTKKTIEDARKTAVTQQLSPDSKVDKAKADAVGKVVEAFAKDDSVHDNTRIDVSVSTGASGFSINVSYDSPFVPMPQPETPKAEAHTEAHDKAKIELNSTTTVTKEREQPKTPEQIEAEKNSEEVAPPSPTTETK